MLYKINEKQPKSKYYKNIRIHTLSRYLFIYLRNGKVVLGFYDKNSSDFLENGENLSLIKIDSKDVLYWAYANIEKINNKKHWCKECGKLKGMLGCRHYD